MISRQQTIFPVSNIRTFEHSNISRKGSALLIVLGMLSFMVVSAVGFAIFMRESRAPSSHLRREATSRYLLKSALANAVARLDGTFDSEKQRIEGIYDDAYPGILPSGYNRGSDECYNGDFWVKRIFAPFGTVDPNTTVSTLTLESLAYLPPAIINEVRVYSRLTRTARWNTLSYDLGRYAFCAVDVSDCFDINKLSSAKRRTSHAGERLSFASLYPDDARAFADALKSAAGTVPFVSLADFNVAFGDTKYTPFSHFITSGGYNSGHMYLGGSDYGEAASNALFITDTWFPATNAVLDVDNRVETKAEDASRHFDLSGETAQPFKKGDWGARMLFELPTSGGLAGPLYHNLGPVGLACLYDYLDDNQLPLSLGLPTVEAVPMICSVTTIGDVTFRFEQTEQADASGSWTMKDAANKTHTIQRTVKACNFRGINFTAFSIVGTAMFPFKRMEETGRGDGSGYTAEALVAVFFTDGAVRSRLTNRKFRPAKDYWGNGKVVDGVAFFKSAPSPLAYEADGVYAKYNCEISKTDLNMPAFYKVTEKDVTPGMFAGGAIEPLSADLEAKLDKEVLTVDGTKASATPFTVFDANGQIDSVLTGLRKKANAETLYKPAERQGNAGGTKQNAADALAAKEFRPCIAVWVRIKKGDKTVDLSPATMFDDNSYLDGCDYEEDMEVVTQCSGANVPILPFTSGQTFKYEESAVDALKGSVFTPTGWNALYAVDPRYNYAPEDWFGTMDNSATPATWKTLMGVNGGAGSVFGVAGRDRDVYMFTSDQKHLQSIGELQFLPFVQGLGQNADSGNFEFGGTYNGNADFASRSPADLGAFANGKRFWRTYSGYYHDNWPSGLGLYNPFRNLTEGGKAITAVSGTGDFRANPLSDDPRVHSAVVAGTPWDYYVASTNRQTNKVISEAENSPANFAFGKRSDHTESQWSDNAIRAIAGELHYAFRSAAENAASGSAFSWENVYENLDWGCEGEGKTGDDQVFLFDDVDLGNGHPLHGVDRKFLCSYWRECYRNRQQLFLVFIRAEPLTVGGLGGDALSNTQLGARGVALVWRDPAPPEPIAKRKARGAFMTRKEWRNQLEECPPHRTRVLFYHQFE